MYLVLQLVTLIVEFLMIYHSQLNSKAREDETLVFCGDLNSFPKSNVINLILNQEPPNLELCYKEFPPEIFSYYTAIYEAYCALKSSVKWATAYENYKRATRENENGGFPDYTNYTENFKATIDYIFYTSKR